MIYFDNSATTQPFPEVVETLSQVMTQYFGNPSSLHALGVQAQELLQAARTQCAEVLGCQKEEVFFTSSGSEANNWAIRGTALAKKARGQHLITTEIEHPSVRRTFEALEAAGFQVTYLPVDEAGQLDQKALKQALTKETTLLSTIGINNEVGVVLDFAAVADILAPYPNLHWHVDGVQSLGKVSPVLFHPRVDFVSYSAHKFNGPRGVGVLVKKCERQIQPLIYGGGQEAGQRAATENLPGIVGTAKAMRLTLDQAENENKTHRAMQKRIRKHYGKQSLVKILSPQAGSPHILTLALPGVRGEVLVHALEEQGIYVSTTSACSSRQQQVASSLLAMHVPMRTAQSAIRLSFGPENTLAEADKFCQSFDQLINRFKKIL